MLMDRISGTSPNFMPHLLWLDNLHDLIPVNVCMHSTRLLSKKLLDIINKNDFMTQQTYL